MVGGIEVLVGTSRPWYSPVMVRRAELVNENAPLKNGT